MQHLQVIDAALEDKFALPQRQQEPADALAGRALRRLPRHLLLAAAEGEMQPLCDLCT